MLKSILDKPSPASIKTRLAAFGWDYIWISVIIAIVASIGSYFAFGPLAEQTAGLFSTPWQADLLAFVTLVLPVLLYFALQESGPQQATWGKHKRGLIVETLDDQRISRGQSMARSAIKLLPWQIAHTCIFNIPGWPLNPQNPPGWVIGGFILVWTLVIFYFVLPIYRTDRRTVYDLIAKTRVTRSNLA